MSVSGAIVAAAMPRRTRCSGIPSSSRWAGLRAAITTIVTTKTTGEKWIGVSDATTRQAYEDQANQSLASHLTGKLMLTHGTTDDNVPPTNTLLVVDALMRAGKDFDLLMIPNSRHGYGDATPYISRRRWDYFVTNLMGATPPKEYHFKSPQ